MLPMQTMPNPISSISDEPALVVSCWRAANTPPTQTGRRQDKESVQLPADEVNERLFTRMTPDETPATKPEAAIFHLTSEVAASEAAASEIAAPEGAKDAQTTQTGHRQNPESLQIPADPVDAPSVTREAREEALEALAALARARLGIAPDPAAATQTGRRQEQKTPSILTDEVKAFIVRAGAL